MSPTKLHSATPEWNNKGQTRQSSVVNFRKERKKTNHKQLDRAILKYTTTYLEQIPLIYDGKLLKIFSKQEKRFQEYMYARSNKLGIKQLENNDSQLLVPSLPASILICHVSSRPQSD